MVNPFLAQVHDLIPGLSDDEANEVLWESTPFPFGPVGELEGWILAAHGEIVARSTSLLSDW